MKILLVLFILLTKIAIAQSNFSKKDSDFQFNYFNSHLNELKDEYGNFILENNNTNLLFTGDSLGDRFGISVADAGDVNGDGYSDIIIGARNSSSTGKAYIYLGGKSMDNIADITFTGLTAGDGFGYSVSSAGDVNGDGYSDVIIVAKYSILFVKGTVLIYYGGLNMDNIPDLELNTDLFSTFYKNSIYSAGDVNGDGFDDVQVLMINYLLLLPRLQIYLGGNNMDSIPDIILKGSYDLFIGLISNSGDINGDGFSDIICSNNNEPKLYIFYGGVSMDSNVDVIINLDTLNQSSIGSFSYNGDIDNDGYSDIIVEDSNTGKVFLFYGGINIHNEADLIFSGGINNESYGFNISFIKDANKDGFSDIAICSRNKDSVNIVYVYYGGSEIDTNKFSVIYGESANKYFGNSVSGILDVNGDGYSDIVLGDESYNDNTGRAYMYTNLRSEELINPIKNSNNNSTIVNFIWDKLNSQTSYNLLLSTDSLFNNIAINDTIINDTSKIISGLNRNTKYYWRVIAEDTSGVMHYSSIWNFKTVPSVSLNLKVLMEGMYSPIYFQLSKRDTVKAYLRDVSPPYVLRDSSAGIIDSITYRSNFEFKNTYTGTYYIISKHRSCIETWSKAGGQILINDGYTYNYDFTNSNTQAYGNNLKLVGTRYCMFTGDVNQDKFINLSDVISVNNFSQSFATGSFLPEDLNGDSIVDLTDLNLCYNNSVNFVSVITP